jgi:methyltransferase (TIGR00027 family)
MTDDHPLDPVAQTSRLTAALRARESARPDRLFNDPFAARLAGPTGEDLLADFGDNAAIAVRTHYYDDKITNTAPRQLVILAAGMDSRAYRLTFPEGTTVFELDRPEVLALKAELLADATPIHRIPVGVDLAADWPTPLREAGFDQDQPTCWLVEGLVQYLTEPQVGQLLDNITTLSAPQSELLIDIVGSSFLESPLMKPMLDKFAQRNMTWYYATDHPEEPLEARGWTPEISLISTIGTDLDRWPFPPQVGEGYFIHALLSGADTPRSNPRSPEEQEKD